MLNYLKINKSYLKCVALKNAIFITISRRVFITLPLVFYLNYKYGDDFYMPMVTEAIIAGFIGSVIHDYIYIVRLINNTQQDKSNE